MSLYNNNNQSRSMEPMGLNYGNAKGLPVLKTLEKGKFEVKERLLGKGSFAKTFLAVNTESKELLACKMINKQDLAPYVRASLEVMDRDSKLMRGEKPFVFTNCLTGQGIDRLVALIRENALFDLAAAKLAFAAG